MVIEQHAVARTLRVPIRSLYVHIMIHGHKLQGVTLWILNYSLIQTGICGG